MKHISYFPLSVLLVFLFFAFPSCSGHAVPHVNIRASERNNLPSSCSELPERRDEVWSTFLEVGIALRDKRSSLDHVQDLKLEQNTVEQKLFSKRTELAKLEIDAGGFLDNSRTSKYVIVETMQTFNVAIEKTNLLNQQIRAALETLNDKEKKSEEARFALRYVEITEEINEKLDGKKYNRDLRETRRTLRRYKRQSKETKRALDAALKDLRKLTAERNELDDILSKIENSLHRKDDTVKQIGGGTLVQKNLTADEVFKIRDELETTQKKLENAVVTLTKADGKLFKVVEKLYTVRTEFAELLEICPAS